MSDSLTRRRFLEKGALSASALALAATPLAACATGATNTRTAAGAAMSFDEYRRLDALGLAALVRHGEVTPAEMLEVAIARAEAVNPAITAITVDHFERARRAARETLPEGPFRGVPYLLKDLAVGMAGTVTTEGSRFFRDARHERDSTVVARFREAGLVIFGKTHSPEFGGSPSSESILHGSTRNPWDPSRSAGGSSGGSAAAVAAGILPLAHATDGGGSIRIPASACGLFGLKPTRGRTPMGPDVYEGWGGLSCGHAVSRTVRDSAALLDAIQGGEAGDAYAAPPRERPFLEEVDRDPGRLRIALMLEPTLPVPVDDACREAALATARLCESLGHVVEEATPTPDLDALTLWDHYGKTVSVGVALKVAAREAALGRAATAEDLEPITRINVEAGRRVTGLEHGAARDTLHRASRVFGRFMRNYDVILCPTTASVAPEIGVLRLDRDYDAFMAPASAASVFTAPFNMTGQPAMSVPLQTTDSGFPVGVMFAGRHGDEATLYRLAGQLERAQPWIDRSPAELV